MEMLLIRHCAPTLAGLKTANLFNCRNKNILADFENCKSNLKRKGIDITILSEREDGALVYVYRKDRLGKDLSCDMAVEVLKQFGYESADVDSCINHLAGRIKESKCFPHEIGLFLGYPVEDVKGFIENNGHNFKCTGYWKVYCNECEAQKTFARYKKCVDVYTRLYKGGRSIEKLTVAV